MSLFLRQSPRLLASRLASTTTTTFTPVESLQAMPSPSSFGETYFDKLPVVVRGGVSHWPALRKWSDPQYLKELAGDAVVPVEIGGSYLSSEMHRADMPLALYLDYLAAAADGNSSGGEEEDQEVPPEHMAYMAQAAVPELLREEAGDVDAPAICGALGRGDQFARMAWIGPRGTVTPLHRDPYHNCLCQVAGAKRVLLYSADDEERLYPIRGDPTRANSSQVDAEAPDLALFPAFGDVERAWSVEIEAGDLLYIPRRWWHHVRSLSKSTSVSFWWL